MKVCIVTRSVIKIVIPNCGVVLSNSEDTQALAQALSKLASDRELRRQMSQASRAINQQHSWASKAKSYLDLFEELSKS